MAPFHWEAGSDGEINRCRRRVSTRARDVAEDPGAQEGGARRFEPGPVQRWPLLPGLLQREVPPVLEVVVVVLADVNVLVGHVLDELVPGLLVQQAGALKIGKTTQFQFSNQLSLLLFPIK